MPDNAYGAISPLGYGYSTAADTCFQEAWRTPNLLAFKGNESTSSTDSTKTETSTADSRSVEGGIPVQTPTAGQSSSNGLVNTLIGGTIFTGGAIACVAAARKGKFTQAWNAVKKFFGSEGAEAAEGTVQNALKKITAVRTENGMRIMIPGKKTKPMTGSEIDRFITENCMEGATKAERLAFSPKSVLQEYQVFNETGVYKITVKDGQITKIVDTKVPNVNILERLTNAEKGTTDSANLQYFNKILSELGKEKDKIDTDILKGVADINYTNTFGDDVLTVSMSEFNTSPQIKTFTTLQRFKPEADEVRSYALASNEKFFANQKFLTGELVDGANVESFSIPKIGGTNITANFEGRKLVSITENGVTFPKDSQGYDAFLDVKANKKAVDNAIKDVFDKHKIPVGAVISSP